MQPSHWVFHETRWKRLAVCTAGTTQEAHNRWSDWPTALIVAVTTRVLCNPVGMSRNVGQHGLIPVLGFLLALSGCTTGTGANAPVAGGPGQIAAKFVTTLYEGRPSDALLLVAPNQRKILSGLPGAYPAGSLSARDVRAGHLTIRGTSARVTIFGTMCAAVRPGPGQAVDPPSKHCVSHNPGGPGGNDFFQYLVEINGAWYVSAKNDTSF